MQYSSYPFPDTRDGIFAAMDTPFSLPPGTRLLPSPHVHAPMDDGEDTPPASSPEWQFFNASARAEEYGHVVQLLARYAACPAGQLTWQSVNLQCSSSTTHPCLHANVGIWSDNEAHGNTQCCSVPVAIPDPLPVPWQMQHDLLWRQARLLWQQARHLACPQTHSLSDHL